jgi:hypothetical protein
MAAEEISNVDEIRAKEASNAVAILTQEQEDQKYKSEPSEKTTFKHYRVSSRKKASMSWTNGCNVNSESSVMLHDGICSSCPLVLWPRWLQVLYEMFSQTLRYSTDILSRHFLP